MPRDEDPRLTLGYWLGLTMRELREDATPAVSPKLVARRFGVHITSIQRFESGTHWPTQVDRLLAVYAELLGAEEPRDYYRLALERWMGTGGTQPVAGPRVPATTRAVAAVQRAAQRTRDTQLASPAGPRAIRIVALSATAR